MVIFENGCDQIILREKEYYLRADVGHFSQKYIEITISKEDADMAMRDPNYLEQLILDYQNKLWGLV